ncbi:MULTISPECIES: alpha/beta hydrolase [Nocardioides]|uniref:Alpha/beta hydrolase n=1 Tax=Nocardioides vastitatis TaxID=2568655 RepID=A0ABW0ZEC1_9ACTN|nr:alpha/beta hydrolase [Nocardioides sp.]THJ04302.1 alpha/beta hydrolase [Nocardioides sp.]
MVTPSSSSGETCDRDVGLDPRARAFLRMLEIWGWPPTWTRTPRQARHDLRILHAATGSWRPVRDVRDARIPGPDGTIPVRVYRPGRRGDTDRPLIVYFHGGGFVIGDLFTADGACRRLANAAGATVVSVHYRRAPEHPLPAAQEDAYAAARWVQQHARQLGADPGRLVVAGDSAGGGLAAHVAQRLRDDGRAPAALQVLVNPGLDFSLEHTDRDPALARLLDWDTIDWFAAHAVPPAVDRTDPVISPSRAPDLTGLPPAVVITAGVDPFRQDAKHYVRALESAGVAVEWHDFPGQLHGFTDMDLVFPAARDSLQRIATAVRRATAAEMPVALVSDERIPWSRPDGGLLRRLWEDAQRLPLVNGPDALRSLLAARLTTAAFRLHPSTGTCGGAGP